MMLLLVSLERLISKQGIGSKGLQAIHARRTAIVGARRGNLAGPDHRPGDHVSTDHIGPMHVGAADTNNFRRRV
jgi:hypothetical protein